MTSLIERVVDVRLLVGIPVLTGLLASCFVTMAPTPTSVATAPSPVVPERSGPPERPTQPLAIDVRVYVDRTGSKQLIAANGLVGSGENFEMVIRPNQPAYVYLAQETSAGVVSILFPEAGDRLLLGNRDFRLPDDVQTWFQVAGQDTEENLFLLAARAPIPDVKALLPHVRQPDRVEAAREPPAAKHAGGTSKDAGVASKQASRTLPQQPLRPDRILDDTTRTVIVVRKLGAVTATIPTEDASGDDPILVRQLHFRRK